MTSSGRVCQNWTYYVSLNNWTWQFPDDVIDDAANFCRNPDHKPLGPWCYYDNGNEWGYCDVPLCSGNGSIYYCASNDAIMAKGWMSGSIVMCHSVSVMNHCTTVPPIVLLWQWEIWLCGYCDVTHCAAWVTKSYV